MKTYSILNYFSTEEALFSKLNKAWFSQEDPSFASEPLKATHSPPQ